MTSLRPAPSRRRFIPARPAPSCHGDGAGTSAPCTTCTSTSVAAVVTAACTATTSDNATPFASSSRSRRGIASNVVVSCRPSGESSPVDVSSLLIVTTPRTVAPTTAISRLWNDRSLASP